MSNENGQFPDVRLRRLRQSAPLRRLVRETRFSPEQLVMPYFVRDGRSVKEAIPSMPGQFRFSPDMLLSEIEDLISAGVSSVLLFGVTDEKDARGSAAASGQGIVQRAVREIKKNFPELAVITDICLCGYTDHGHCGLVAANGEIDNDATLKILADTALSHAEAGADMLAPSDMMDGRIRAIRRAVDARGFSNLPIMSYAAKYASAFYGPFRDAAHSAPSFGDRKTYQMDPANRQEAIREMRQDVEEGADILMVKPALAYLDVIRDAAREFSHPIAAYSVSGEYSMIKAAAEKGLLDEKRAVLEITTGILRAGARILITYYAPELARWEALEGRLGRAQIPSR